MRVRVVFVQPRFAPKASQTATQITPSNTATTRKVRLTRDQILLRMSLMRAHASSRAFLLTSLAPGCSPARMKPCPAPS